MWSCDFPEVLHRTTKCYLLQQDPNIQSHLTNWTNHWSVTGGSLVVWCLWMVILIIEPSLPATQAQEWRTVHQEGQQGRLFGLAGLASELGLQKAQSHCPEFSPKSLKTSHTRVHTHTHTHTATETWSHWKWEPSVTTTGTLSRAKTSATAHHQRHAWGSLLQGNRTKLLVWPWHRKMWEFYFWIQPFPSWYSSTQISVLNKVAARNWSVRFEFRSLWPHSHSDILVFSGMFPPKFMGHLNYNKERNCFVS